MSAIAEQHPVASGSLAETPFGHLTIYLYRRSTTGTLVLTGRAGSEASIRFLQGRPTAARVPWPAQRLLDALLPLCSLEDGEFRFFEADLLTGREDALTGVVDPYEMLVASLDQHARDDMVDAVLKRYQGVKLRLQPGRDLDRLGLSSESRPLIELIRAAPATVAELIEQSPLRSQQVKRLLYALVVTHMISLHEERSNPIYKSQLDARSGRPPFVQINEIAIGFVPAWQSLASLRPGMPISSRPGGKISGPPGASLRPTFTIAPPRLQPSMPVPTATEDRATRLRKAEQLMLRGPYDEVLALVDGLLDEEPERADLLALRGHALFEKHRTSNEGLPRTVIDALKKALELDPDQPRALYARGLVFQSVGETKKAVASFKRVLQVDPKHIEARREIRLARLRQG